MYLTKEVFELNQFAVAYLMILKVRVLLVSFKFVILIGVYKNNLLVELVMKL